MDTKHRAPQGHTPDADISAFCERAAESINMSEAEARENLLIRLQGELDIRTRQRDYWQNERQNLLTATARQSQRIAELEGALKEANIANKALIRDLELVPSSFKHHCPTAAEFSIVEQADSTLVMIREARFCPIEKCQNPAKCGFAGNCLAASTLNQTEQGK